MLNVEQTIISQYTHSPIINQIIGYFNGSIDPNADLEHFCHAIWSVDTAQTYGLNVWGRIVGIEREIRMSAQDEFIGFTQGFVPFGSGAWGVDESTDRVYQLDDDTYRKVIMLKAMSNIIYATAPNINRLLRAMFGKRGRAYFVKNGTMAARYVFEFYLLPVERAVIRQTDLLPHPCGVLLDFYEPEVDATFGYKEANLAPFGQGAFFMGV